MSEPETEYETEHETDVEPTPFASAPWEPERPDESGHAHVWGSDGDLVATVCDNPVYGETAFDRARLIAAAGTAAQEAREMGYDPQEAVEVLPKLLRAAEKMKDYGHLSKCDKILMNGDYPCSCGWQEYVDALNDALASAEGSGDE